MLKPLHILIIEDNPGDQEFIGAVLGKYNVYMLTQAYTLAKGLEYMANKEFDVVLLDLFLPDVVGVEPLQAYYEIQARYPNQVVVIITSLNDRDVAIQSISVGAQDYFSKELISMNNDGLPMAISKAYERGQHNQGMVPRNQLPTLIETEVSEIEELRRRLRSGE